MPTTDALETFILDELAQGRDVGAIGTEDDLLATGLVDSHGIMEIVAFLEQRHGISIADDDLVPENFQTIAGIRRLVARKETPC